MKVKFVFWWDFESEEYVYELKQREFDNLRELARQELLDSLSGATIEEKAQQIINEYGWEQDKAENIINEMVDIMLAEGDFDELARELFEDSAREEYRYRDF